jgi:CTP synthase
MAWQSYGSDEVWERHRHRYEVNPEYVPLFEEKGLVISGKSPDRIFVEVIELTDHPWFLACQFHPEFKSRPYEPHPLFASFIAAAVNHKGARLKDDFDADATTEYDGVDTVEDDEAAMVEVTEAAEPSAVPS